MQIFKKKTNIFHDINNARSMGKWSNIPKLLKQLDKSGQKENSLSDISSQAFISTLTGQHLLMAENKTSESQTQFKQALDIDPGSSESLVYLTIIDLFPSSPQTILQSYHQPIRLSSLPPSSINFLPHIYTNYLSKLSFLDQQQDKLLSYSLDIYLLGLNLRSKIAEYISNTSSSYSDAYYLYSLLLDQYSDNRIHLLLDSTIILMRTALQLRKVLIILPLLRQPHLGSSLHPALFHLYILFFSRSLTLSEYTPPISSSSLYIPKTLLSELQLLLCLFPNEQLYLPSFIITFLSSSQYNHLSSVLQTLSIRNSSIYYQLFFILYISSQYSQCLLIAESYISYQLALAYKKSINYHLPWNVIDIILAKAKIYLNYLNQPTLALKEAQRAQQLYLSLFKPFIQPSDTIIQLTQCYEKLIHLIPPSPSHLSQSIPLHHSIPNNEIKLYDEDKSPLMDLCLDGKFTQVLIQGETNLNLQNKDGMTALMYACSQGHTLIINLLCDNPSINIHCSNKDGHTALDYLLILINDLKIKEEEKNKIFHSKIEYVIGVCYSRLSQDSQSQTELISYQTEGQISLKKVYEINPSHYLSQYHLSYSLLSMNQYDFEASFKYIFSRLSLSDYISHLLSISSYIKTSISKYSSSPLSWSIFSLVLHLLGYETESFQSIASGLCEDENNLTLTLLKAYLHLYHQEFDQSMDAIVSILSSHHGISLNYSLIVYGHQNHKKPVFSLIDNGTFPTISLPSLITSSLSSPLTNTKYLLFHTLLCLSSLFMTEEDFYSDCDNTLEYLILYVSHHLYSNSFCMARIYYVYGQLYLKMKDYSKSIISFQTSLSFSPSYIPSLEQLCSIYLSLSHPNMALSYAYLILDLTSSNHTAYITLQHCQYLKGKEYNQMNRNIEEKIEKIEDTIPGLLASLSCHPYNLLKELHLWTHTL